MSTPRKPSVPPFFANVGDRVTDKDQVVPRKEEKPRDLANDKTAQEQFEKGKAKVIKAGGRVIAEPRTGANCHGYTFDKGDSNINETDVAEKILPDNYTKKKPEEAEICDVVVYDAASGKPEHSGLVVEIGPDHKPSRIVSKWGPNGGIFEHPPDTYGIGDHGPPLTWDVFRRNTDPDGLKPQRDAYNDEAKKKPQDLQKMRDLALLLCQKRNALKVVAPH
jgi:hypothetical protein